MLANDDVKGGKRISCPLSCGMVFNEIRRCNHSYLFDYALYDNNAIRDATGEEEEINDCLRIRNQAAICKHLCPRE